MIDDSLKIQFGGPRLKQRQVDELVGLAAGIVADGVVNQEEAEFLYKWLLGYSDLVNQNPMMRPILERVKEMLSDNVLDDEEAQELMEILGRFSGATFELGEVAHSTSLPLDRPVPEIIFSNKQFCFTGNFYFGNRKKCEDRVEECGGRSGSLTQKTSYLIIGTYVTSSWLHASFGNKISKAVELREKEYPISIISEDHWLQQSEKLLQ